MEFQVTTQYFFADGGGLYRESDGGRYVGVVREATEGTKANGAAVEAACGKPISSIARAINLARFCFAEIVGEDEEIVEIDLTTAIKITR